MTIKHGHDGKKHAVDPTINPCGCRSPLTSTLQPRSNTSVPRKVGLTFRLVLYTAGFLAFSWAYTVYSVPCPLVSHQQLCERVVKQAVRPPRLARPSSRNQARRKRHQIIGRDVGAVRVVSPLRLLVSRPAPCGRCGNLIVPSCKSVCFYILVIWTTTKVRKIRGSMSLQKQQKYIDEYRTGH